MRRYSVCSLADICWLQQAFGLNWSYTLLVWRQKLGFRTSESEAVPASKRHSSGNFRLKFRTQTSSLRLLFEATGLVVAINMVTNSQLIRDHFANLAKGCSRTSLTVLSATVHKFANGAFPNGWSSQSAFIMSPLGLEAKLIIGKFCNSLVI